MGPQGPQGVIGPQGEQGPGNITFYQVNGPVQFGTGKVTSVAECNSTDVSIKGLSDIQIIGSQPNATLTGSSTETNWITQVSGNGTYRVHSIVFCFNNP
jgi:hypothetical protein